MVALTEYMGSDLIFLVGLALLSFAAKSYSATVSLAFEKIYIKFFRTLVPSYGRSYFRSFLLSLISFRNQGISFTALSFLNSGIIPNYQALGLILGSYLGLTFSLFYLNLHDTILKFIFVALALVLNIYTTRSKVTHISRLFFFMAMILFGFDLMLTSMFSNDVPAVVGAIHKAMMWSGLSVIPLTLLFYFLFRNSFVVLAILYAFFLKGTLSPEQVLNSILSVVVYNSFWYLWTTSGGHRETKAVSYAAVLIAVTTSILVVSLEIIFPNVLVQSHRNIVSFISNLFILTLIMGIGGYILSRFLNSFTDSFFPRPQLKEPRHIQLFTSKNHYPSAFLLEFFEQEFKKLFALLNSTQQMVVMSWVHPKESSQERIQKYFNISLRILKELEDLEIQIIQVEKTFDQAEKTYKLHDKLVGLKNLSLSLRALNDIKQKFGNTKYPELDKNRILFIRPVQKILEFCEFIFSQSLDSDKEFKTNMSTLLSQLTDELIKFKEELINLKSTCTFNKDEIELIYEFLEQVQLLNLALHKVAK